MFNKKLYTNWSQQWNDIQNNLKNGEVKIITPPHQTPLKKKKR